MGEPLPFPFGVETSRSFSSFAVLDKSFLDGVSSAQLQYFAQQGWTFGVVEALMYELLRKRDRRRVANLFKLHSIEDSLVLLPGIGEMFRAETKTLKPASTILRAKLMNLIAQKGPSGEFFELNGPACGLKASALQRREKITARKEMYGSQKGKHGCTRAIFPLIRRRER